MLSTVAVVGWNVEMFVVVVIGARVLGFKVIYVIRVL